ncbi:43267_t:CDS:2 [Gigaspora margarita]|uniref:43267_t:CDS:1 n=1 Tax=Gigaspora margarita TaxID=4874 RepID=A0ABN7V207_GIGMA|nr:43267_t:CDS:2 [Gigaspora margarita]
MPNELEKSNNNYLLFSVHSFINAYTNLDKAVIPEKPCEDKEIEKNK